MSYFRFVRVGMQKNKVIPYVKEFKLLKCNKQFYKMGSAVGEINPARLRFLQFSHWQ